MANKSKFGKFDLGYIGIFILFFGFFFFMWTYIYPNSTFNSTQLMEGRINGSGTVILFLNRTAESINWINTHSNEGGVPRWRLAQCRRISTAFNDVNGPRIQNSDVRTTKAQSGGGELNGTSNRIEHATDKPALYGPYPLAGRTGKANYENFIKSRLGFGITGNKKRFQFITLTKGGILKNQQKRGAYVLKVWQVDALILSAPTIDHKIAIQLMAHAGLRRSEVINLLRTEIDINNNRILVKNSKGNKSRIVPITPEFSQELDFYCTNPIGYVMQGRDGNPMHKSTLNNWIANVGTLAGIENPVPGMTNINPHALRHYCARYLKNKGMSIESIQNIMGHASYKTTMDTYGLMSFDDIQKEFTEKVIT